MSKELLAIILAAGIGKRLGAEYANLPKCLLPMGERTLLERHLELLQAAGVGEIVIGTGFESGRIQQTLDRWPGTVKCSTFHNPDYRQGSIVTLWHARDLLRAGKDVLVMDADVLYGRELLERLVRTGHANCFLLDRDLEAGEEPVKLCVRDGRLVEFRKRIEIDAEYCGESVGFFRFSPAVAAELAARVEAYVAEGRVDEPHEEAIRDLLLSEPSRFGFEDVTGLPWIEVDFPQDVIRARDEILPRIGD
jgi:choline kinase